MDEEFQKLLRSGLYQVFLFTCPATIPFGFARHPWFVINKKGNFECFGVGQTAGAQRWEVFWKPENDQENWGHLHRNALPPTQGIPIFFSSRKFLQKYFWKGTLHGYVEGEEGSVAQKLLECVENSPHTYPYCDTYSLKGPNSNTYVQWTLDQFPQSGLNLPWNSFGKGFK